MNIKGKWVYLSGKMTGLPGFNRQAFSNAAVDLMEKGARTVYNPAWNAPKVEEAREHSFYMIHDLHELTKYNFEQDKPSYDVIALLPGWEDSQGACIELQVAIACGLEVLHLE